MCSCYIFMFFTQNTAYDFRISDWSSDVFSSDLYSGGGRQPLRLRRLATGQRHDWRSPARGGRHRREHRLRFPDPRKSSFRERQPACPSSRIERQEHQVTRDSKERRSEEHTSELQSLMRISYAVFCLKKKNTKRRM